MSKRTRTRKTYTAEYKTKLVLEAIREESRLEEIAAANEINPNMLRNWKQEFLKNASSVFSQKESKAAKRAEQKKEAALEKEKTKMLKKIGQLTLERDFLQDCFRACDLPVPEYDKSEGSTLDPSSVRAHTPESFRCLLQAHRKREEEGV